MEQIHLRLTEPAPQIFSTSDTSRSDGRTRIPLTSAVTRRCRSCSRITNATRRSPLCCASNSNRRSNVARPCGGIDSRMATDLASRSRTISIGVISVARIRTDSSSRSKRPCDQNAAAVLGVVAVLLKRLREDDDLDAASGIIEREDAHAVAFARLERTEPGDDTAD